MSSLSLSCVSRRWAGWTHKHTHTHTHTQNDYRNPRCACAPRVNKVEVFLSQFEWNSRDSPTAIEAQILCYSWLPPISRAPWPYGGWPMTSRIQCTRRYQSIYVYNLWCACVCVYQSVGYIFFFAKSPCMCVCVYEFMMSHDVYTRTHPTKTHRKMSRKIHCIILDTFMHSEHLHYTVCMHVRGVATPHSAAVKH